MHTIVSTLGSKRDMPTKSLSQPVGAKLCGRQNQSSLVYRLYICFSYERLHALQLYHHDLYDRSVVASEAGKWITSDLAIRTLAKALHFQKKKPKSLILHSDQGSQFTSIQFIRYCQKHGIVQSMSAVGCPYDNAPMERYYNTFKAKLINRFNFRTDEKLTYAVSEYAYVWYNQIRPHSYNDYRTPYEARYGLH
jgi:transposase InsO family protein